MIKYAYIFLFSSLLCFPVKNVTKYTDLRKLPGANDTSSEEMKFISISPGKFMMGSKAGEKNEKPVHEVVIIKNFEMQETEVTQHQWQKIMGNNPSSFIGADRPVESISWNNIHLFIDKLNQLNDGYYYRLPTEEEWEYACRAGSKDDFTGNADEMCYYDKNSGLTTHPVRTKSPNKWGLYDMNGNVWEWVQDEYLTYNQKRSGRKGSGEKWKVMRGGGWHTAKESCRAAMRLYENPDFKNSALGFRLVRTRMSN
jgi:formylglycine-generating enzyme required for sulfatase activity